MPAESLSVAVVGLSFGAEFVPIYQAHPAVQATAVCDADVELLADVGDRFGVDRRFGDLDDVLASDVDAVHLVTPLPLHAAQAIAAMEAGKDVACTVPMALSLDDLQRVIDCAERTGRRYLMMETAVFTREFLYVRDLVARGELGTITYAHGAHFQDMTGWPPYWRGLPPSYYLTHAIAPLLCLLQTQASTVRCVGAGSRTQDADAYGNAFTVESAVFTLADRDVVVDVVRSLYDLARPYAEAFSVYGDRASFEWPQREGHGPALLHRMGEAHAGRGRPISTEEVVAPDRADLLPPEIRRFTTRAVHEDGSHRSFVQGGGHGGSHPHLVGAFVRAVTEGRPSVLDARHAAAWTAAGIYAHQSAMAGGSVVEVPRF